MSWIQQNPFLSGLIGVTALATAGAAYFSYSSQQNFAVAEAEYTGAVSRLQRLQNNSPFPNEENLAAIEALGADYQTRLNHLIELIAKRQSPYPEVTPQEFQDNLRAVVSKISDLAKENVVTLPDDFYMGFDPYRGTLPNDSAAPVLAAQLGGVESIMTDLIEMKVQQINAVSRPPIPEESSPSGPAENAEAPLLAFKPLDITFTADLSRVRAALNAIISSDRFIILRSLTVANSAPDGPSRAIAPETTANVSQDPFNQLLGGQTNSESAEKTGMTVVVGREVVTVAMRLEMVTFNLPGNEK